MTTGIVTQHRKMDHHHHIKHKTQICFSEKHQTITMEPNTKNQDSLHIVMFPWLAHGHVMPFFELSKLLAQKGHKISFLSTPKNLNRVSHKIPQTLSHLITLVPLSLPKVNGLPEGSESTSELPINKVPFLKKAFDGLEPGLAAFLAEASPRVSLIVNDFANHWLGRVIEPLGIRSVYFTILCATTMVFYGSWEESLRGSRTRPEDYTVAPPWMGSDVVSFKLCEIISHWECMDDQVPDYHRFGTTLELADAVLVRSCPEFESDSLNRLATIYDKPVIPVGLMPPALEDYASQLRDERFDGLRMWLDDKDPASVLYIALGTEVCLSPESARELASGVEKTGLPFVWVVNNRPLVEGASDVVPPGFEARVSGRGLVWRGWAPQLGILAHCAVGGFLTHCGWSSVIEGLAMGRALILFPGGSSDLGLVARLLEGRGIGLEIPRDNETGWFDSDSVAESIRRVMVDPEGVALRTKAKAMREIFGDLELQHKHLDNVAEFVTKLI